MAFAWLIGHHPSRAEHRSDLDNILLDITVRVLNSHKNINDSILIDGFAIGQEFVQWKDLAQLQLGIAIDHGKAIDHPDLPRIGQTE